MENNTNTKSIMLNNGIALGLTTIGISVINYVSGFDVSHGWIGGVLGVFAMIYFIYMGIKKNRDQVNGGFISLGQALKVGIAIALVAGVLASIYQVIFLYYIDPEYLSRIQALQLEKMLETNPDMPEETIQMMQDMGDKFSSPWITFASSLVGNLFFGFIFALFSGLILKKDDSSIDSL